jgi:predicted transcriptional regulator
MRSHIKINGRIPLSDAELAVLRAIRDHVSKRRLSPTYDEVAQQVSRSKSTIRHTITRLIKKGVLGMAEGRFRNLYLTDLGHKAARRK